MDFFKVLLSGITIATTLAAFVATLYGSRQKSNLTLLREGNADYKDRNAQLEADSARKDAELEKANAEIVQLRAEKQLPLENLTKLIITQHTQVMESILQSKSTTKPARGKKK